MKNIINLILFFVPFIFSNALSAQTSFRSAIMLNEKTIAGDTPSTPSFHVKIIPDENREKFILSVQNPAEEHLKISVEGASGQSYEFQSAERIFRKRFDMSAAEDGNYTVTVTNGKKGFKRKLSITTTTEIIRTIAINDK